VGILITIEDYIHHQMTDTKITKKSRGTSLLKEGLTTEQVSIRLGVSRNTVSKWARLTGVTPPSNEYPTRYEIRSAKS